jgi:hypothetical protein
MKFPDKIETDFLNRLKIAFTEAGFTFDLEKHETVILIGGESKVEGGRITATMQIGSPVSADSDSSSSGPSPLRSVENLLRPSAMSSARPKRTSEMP